jgi:hypothetical protein
MGIPFSPNSAAQGHVETGGDAKGNNTTKAIACGYPNAHFLIHSGKIV